MASSSSVIIDSSKDEDIPNDFDVESQPQSEDQSEDQPEQNLNLPLNYNPYCDIGLIVWFAISVISCVVGLLMILGIENPSNQTITASILLFTLGGIFTPIVVCLRRGFFY